MRYNNAAALLQKREETELAWRQCELQKSHHSHWVSDDSIVMTEPPWLGSLVKERSPKKPASLYAIAKSRQRHFPSDFLYSWLSYLKTSTHSHTQRSCVKLQRRKKSTDSAVIQSALGCPLTFKTVETFFSLFFFCFPWMNQNRRIQKRIAEL